MYPKGNPLDLIATSFVTEPTRRVLENRLVANGQREPNFFDTVSYETLQAVCARLIDQSGRKVQIDVAAAIDGRLNDSIGKGWRYDRLPDDYHTFRLGLAGIDVLARDHFQMPFSSLDPARQDEILAALARGDAAERIWTTLPADLFFEELLALAVEIYYANPFVQGEIGYVGFADAAGWQHIGLDEYEPWEPHEP